MRRYIFLAVQICNCVTLISELSWELFEQLMFCFLSGNLVHRFTGSSVFTRHSQHSDICSSVRAVCMSSRQKCRYYADTSCFSFSSLFVFFRIGNWTPHTFCYVSPSLFPTDSHFVNQPFCCKDKIKHCCGPHIQSLLTRDFHFPSFMCC